MVVAAHHEVRFPEFVQVGLTIGPGFETDIVEFASGKEQRNQLWEEARLGADVAKAIQTDDEYATILEFFRARRGKFHSFRFKDWSDFRLVQESTVPAAGDGFEKIFQISMNYEDVSEPPASTSIRPQVRTILKLRGGPGDPIETPDSPGTVVRVNGIVQVSGFTIDYDLGTITFTVAPTDGHPVDFTGEFDVPSRFDTKRLGATLEDFNATAVGSLPIVEVNLL